MTAQTVNFSINVDDVFNPVYVAVATGVATCQTNTDPRGGTWTSRTMPATTAWQSVDYGNGTIVAVSSTSGQIAATSTDGTTWVQRLLPTSTTWYAVKYGDLATNDKWVAVSSAGNYAATSPDGCTWTAQTITGDGYAWKSMEYGNGVWVALANVASVNKLTTAVTSDGITWTNHTATNITCPGTWSSITFGNGKFMAVCSGSTVAAYSTNGLSWTATDALPANTAWVSVCYGDGYHIAVTATDSTKAARSTNGTSWSEITFPATSTWRAVIYGKNILGEKVFASVGALTVGNYSLDGGITWAAKGQVTNTYTAACYAPIIWFSADTLTVANNATLTVNTEQKRFWATMALTNGLLDIKNTTRTGITFAMGRASGAAAGTITPGSGLGNININGGWIDIGTGSGAAGQRITAPFTDYIPAVWVENPNVPDGYTQWLNATGAYGNNDAYALYEGLDAVGSGNRGNFFTQGSNAGPYELYPRTTTAFANQRSSRYLKVDSTAGIIAGAQILGAGITAATVVNRVISSTELELNLPTAYTVRTDWTADAYGTPSGVGTYVAISKNYSDVAAYSINAGVTWTKCYLPFKADWRAICWGGTSARFVAVCSNSNLCAVSSNGITWTTQSLVTTQNWKAVASNGTSFVAVGATAADAATTIGAYSADGLTWAANTMTSAIYQAVCWGTNRYVAVSSTFTSNWDADGAGTWTPGGTMTAGNFAGIAYNGTRFVAISGNSTVSRYSDDGAVTWGTGGVLPNSLFTAICWTGTTFIATSTSGTAAQTAVTSTDSAAWANRTLGVNQWSAICWGSVAVAVAGSNGTNFAGSTASTASATGITWTNQAGMVSDVVFACFNPYKNQLTDQLIFGDGYNGNVVPLGAKIRCPNLMITSLTPANLHTVDNKLGCYFDLSKGGKVIITNTLFDECYHSFLQAQKLWMTDVAFSIPFLVSECYDVNLTRVAFALQPVRRYFTYPYWYSRDLRYGQNVAWSYINNAEITDLLVCTGAPHTRYGTTTATSPITFSYTDGALFTRLKFYVLNPIKANHLGFYASSMVNNCTFIDGYFYGCAPYTLSTSNNNIFTNTTITPTLFSGKTGLAAGTRIGIDPITRLPLENNKKYYFKARSYRDCTNLDAYAEGPVVSATTFVGSKWFPPTFSAVNTASTTVTFNWARRDPSSASIACYEIFRGSSPGFVRNLAARVYTTTTSSTITTTDATVSNGSTYYYVMRKYDGSLAGITNSSGTIGTYILGTSQNFLTGLGSIANCAGIQNTRKVTIPSGSASNFYAGNVWVGMPIGGGGLAANTIVVSIDNELEITVDRDISSTFASQPLTLGAIAGLYVSGTGIVAGTKIVSVNSATQITVDTAFSGAVSGTITFLYGTEGPEVEVYVAGAKQTASNLLFQSYDFTNATWVKTNITATAAVFFPPEQVGFNATTAPTALGVRLTSIGPGANMVNTQAGLANATSYCFSMYAMMLPSLQFSTTCTITINTTVPTTKTFTVTGKWQRIELPFTSTNTTHIFTIAINTNGASIYASCLQVNAGSTATMPVTTTVAAVTLNPIVQEITGAYAWGRSTGGTQINQGIEIVLATAPTGTHFTNIYMGTFPTFRPSVKNLVDSTFLTTLSAFSFTTSSNNIVDTIIQEEKGQAGTLIVLAGALDSKFKNINYDFGFGVSTLFNISNLSNNNLFHNFNIKNYRNYIAASSITSVNNASNIIIQNCYFDTFDLPILINSLNTILKGISGCNATPAGSATTWALGGTLDGIGVLTANPVYDTIFNEFYHSPTTGSINLVFNDSSQTVKPYGNIVGTPTFTNTSKLYLQNHGDSITFTWPHLIKGVTSFRNMTPKLNGLDLGTAVDTLFGVLVEFAISNDSGLTYSNFLELTGPNLVNTTITSSTIGFGLKIRITCRRGMKYTSQSASFILGEVIKGSSSLATAQVLLDNDLGTTGDIILGPVTGTFIPGEAIVRSSDNAARATNLATNTNFALFPSFTSYIDGLQIYTNVNPAIKYATSVDPMTITVVNSSLVPIENTIVRVTATQTVEGFTTGDVILVGLTNSSGVITAQIPSTVNVTVSIRVRKATGSPFYKSSDTPNTFINGVGLSATIVLIQDG